MPSSLRKRHPLAPQWQRLDFLTQRPEGFAFPFQPYLPEGLVKGLAELSFIDNAENISFGRSASVEKTHINVARGINLCQVKRVLSRSGVSLLDQLIEFVIDRSIGRTPEGSGRLDLPIIDEHGYMAIDKSQTNVFFQPIIKRYEEWSIILTSDEALDEWGDVF